MLGTEPNEPINPTIWDERHNPEFVRDNDGLTKREYFAAIAMQGLITSNDWKVSILNDPMIETTAKYACKFSDVLIKVLNETQP